MAWRHGSPAVLKWSDAAPARLLVEVLSISKLGPHAAAMNLQIACGGTLYHDHLAMLRVQGKWQILFKTWTAAPLASCEAAKGA